MKGKILNLLLLITSLIGYLEWGSGNHSFLFQVEAEVISKLITNAKSVIHPFTLLPLAGQLLLIITLFQKTPGRYLTYLGIAGIGILLILMFAIGLMGLNFKIVLSTLPFLTVAFLAFRHHRKKPTQSQ